MVFFLVNHAPACPLSACWEKALLVLPTTVMGPFGVINLGTSKLSVPAS